MGTTTTKKLMTAEEFCDWVHQPEQADKWFELVRGEVIELPAPQKPHGVLCFNIGRILGNFVFERGCGYLTSNDSGVILERDPDTVRGPDIAYYEDANTYAELHPKYGEVPPLLAVEVMSPNERIGKIMRKIMDYLHNGVELVWLIDPETRNVTVYRPGKEAFVAEENQELTGEDVLPGFRCLVSDFFRLPGEKPKAEQSSA
ncbi:MAG TPA: Uma2 family endonuclease [Gemmataceae bacterium]|nr:Uma2 family endonuclease [Gemmataceae bacterium]